MERQIIYIEGAAGIAATNSRVDQDFHVIQINNNTCTTT
jgi:hypothetical protein